MDFCPSCGVQEGAQTLKKCTGCKSIAYCSPKCQKSHWKIHKKQCTSFTITYDPSVGHQWIATRDLKAGTLILSETPILYCPAFVGSNWVCLACGLDFQRSQRGVRSIRLCSKCHWPLCSFQCESNPVHALNECQIFSEQKTQFPPEFLDILNDDLGALEGDFEKGNLISKFIDIIRGLGWRLRDRKSYDEMMNAPYILDSEVDKLGPASLDIIRRRVVLLKKFISLDEFQLRDDDELIAFMRQEPWNKFVCVNEDDEIERAVIHGTYLQTSRMNHSCAPNCVKLTLPFPSLVIKIRTAVGVTKGQTLTISYMPSQTFCRQGRAERHAEIERIGWAFHCQCDRCLDPKELGAHTDAVLCPCQRVDPGHLLPKNPIDFKDSALWLCEKCGQSKYYGEIKQFIEQVGIELQQIKFKEAGSQPKEIENFIEKYGGKILHKNHFLIVAAASNFVQFYEGQEIDLTREELYKVKKWREYLLQIDNIVAPGISQVRGISLFWLCYVIGMRLIHGDEINLSEQEKMELLKQALKFNEESAIFFNYDKEVIYSHGVNCQTLSLLKDSMEEVTKASTIT